MKNLLKFFTAFLILLSSNYSISQVAFTDVAPSLGVNDAGAAQGVVFLDVNNDGWLDIFLVNNNNQSKLWINNNGTGYTESSASWGVNFTSPTRGISAADFNNDGFIDVMIGNWQTPIMLFKNTGTTFIDFSSNAGVNFMAYGGSINWFDYNKDGKIDVLFANDGMPPRYNYFFRNDNLTSFTNIAYTCGLTDSSSTLTIASADYDNDGYLDLFLGTQSNPGSVCTGILFHNNGNGTFSDVTMASGLQTTYYTWGSEWGDFNNDGYMDIYLASTTGYNQLFKNNGNGTFTDVAVAMGVNDQGQSYSCGWADYDNDGDLDLYVAKGQTYPDKMYRNDGSVFTDVSASVGMGDLRHSSCISWGDFNNDGFLDLYLNNNGTENRLYKNNAASSNKWIVLKLVGVNTNKSAIGTRVRAKTGSLNQIREVEGGSGGKGQNSLPVEFGFGTAAIIDSLIINWQSGLVQRFANVVPNTIYTITEGQPLGVNNGITIIPDKLSLSQNYPNPFNPVTTINYTIPEVNLNYSPVVQLKVYDALGKEITTLVNERKFPGSYSVIFNGKNLMSGIYFYSLKYGNMIETKKMILLK